MFVMLVGDEKSLHHRVGVALDLFGGYIKQYSLQNIHDTVLKP